MVESFLRLVIRYKPFWVGYLMTIKVCLEKHEIMLSFQYPKIGTIVKPLDDDGVEGF